MNAVSVVGCVVDDPLVVGDSVNKVIVTAIMYGIYKLHAWEILITSCMYIAIAMILIFLNN